MLNLNWDKVRSYLYSNDGGLRDITVGNIQRNDWEKWFDHVSNYDSFIISSESKSKGADLSFNDVENYWDSTAKESIAASFKLNKDVLVKCYFSEDITIENDISPQDIKTEIDHEAIISYMKDISKLLKKTVTLSFEMDDKPILTVLNDEINLRMND